MMLPRRNATASPVNRAGTSPVIAGQSEMMATWLNGDIPRALEIAAATPATDPLYLPAQAILLGVAFDNGECTLHNALAAAFAALRVPITDVDLRVSILRNAAIHSSNVNRLIDARRYLREIQELRHVVHPRLRMVPAITTWYLARAEDDYASQLAAIEEGFSLVERKGLIPLERQGLARLTLYEQRVDSALENHDIRLAAQAIPSVRENQIHALFTAWSSWEVSGANLCNLMGQYEAGLEYLRRMTPQVRRITPKAAGVAEGKLLIRLGRFAEADAIIERLSREVTDKGASEGLAEVAAVDVAALQALRAIAARDTENVWKAAELMAAATRCDHPTWSKRANELLIEVELGAGRLSLARRLLDREDPDRGKARYRIPWARLHWQEGDRATAIDYFTRALRDVLPDYPGYIARQLQFAKELSAHDVALLWATAMQRLGPEFARTTRDTATEKSQSPGGTIGRRQRLLALFDHHPRLTRAHVAALLPCSHNTATRDLEALVKEGQIKRVITSGHLRTSYFIRIR